MINIIHLSRVLRNQNFKPTKKNIKNALIFILKTANSKQKACLNNLGFKINILTFQGTKYNSITWNHAFIKTKNTNTLFFYSFQIKQTCNIMYKGFHEHVITFKTLHLNKRNQSIKASWTPLSRFVGKYLPSLKSSN